MQNMQIKASLKNYRMAPRKIRLIADLVRGKSADKAKQELEFYSKRAALPVLSLLNSAIANAKKNFEVKENEVSDLHIKEIFVEESRKLKRWRPVSRGSAHPIQKKTSNVVIVLEKKDSDKKEKKEIKADEKNKTKKDKK